jgi:UDP-3-O-[3-hydroxymyristoyl] glucosamine N-acyltransferase
VSSLAQAGPDTVTYLSDRSYRPQLAAARPGACFLRPDDADGAPAGCVVLLTATPQLAYSMAAERLHRARLVRPGEAVAVDAVVEEGVLLGAGVVVGPGARIGRGTVIGPNTVVGPGVAIGRDCRIGPNVSIGFALIGDRVTILAGAAIGEAGFGAAAGPQGMFDLPQLGRAIIQDGVTIGANSCVDRGAFGDTVIGENTKIDNQVQIAHNVQVGRNCVMAAHVGISGSVVVGDDVQFGGQAGVGDHVTIGSGARLAAGSGVIKYVPPGETWGGAPARPAKRWMREIAWLARMAARRGEGPKE